MNADRGPRFLHGLTPSPRFIGRESERRFLLEHWREGPPGVLALLGLGGSGKTALAVQLLEDLPVTGPEAPSAVVAWSFYVSQDVGAFFREASRALSGEPTWDCHALTALSFLRRALSKQRRPLIILDGLERIQWSAHHPPSYGDVRDPLLGQTLEHLARGLGEARCVVTSRFPLKRLHGLPGYAEVDVERLAPEDARALLRRGAVRGDDAALDQILDAFGCHALTLDHLAGYLSAARGGQAEAALALPNPELPGAALQERRLARVLQAYQEVLSETERALIGRLCVFRASATADGLFELFCASGQEGALAGLSRTAFDAALRALIERRLVLGGDALTAHPAVRDFFLRGLIDAEAAHRRAEEHFSALVGAPGVGLPDAPEVLDRLEEMVYHACERRRFREARALFLDRLGGTQHLGWRLGQYQRCLRILDLFPLCPDPAGRVWCYRALGELELARAAIDPDDDWWGAMLLLLEGRLPEVAELLKDRVLDPIALISEALMERRPLEDLKRAPVWFGLPVTIADLFLQASRLDEAEVELKRAEEKLASADYETGWHDERARLALQRGDLARRRGDLLAARAALDEAAMWIRRAGSREHQILLQLHEARQARAEGALEAAAAVLKGGIDSALQAGFGLLAISLQREASTLARSLGDLEDAEAQDRGARFGVLRESLKPAPGVVEAAELAVLGAEHPRCGLRRPAL